MDTSFRKRECEDFATTLPTPVEKQQGTLKFGNFYDAKVVSELGDAFLTDGDYYEKLQPPVGLVKDWELSNLASIAS